MDRSQDLPRNHQERWRRAQQLLREYIDAGGSLNTPLHGDGDGFEEAERRLVESNPALAGLLAEMTDDEVALFAVWVQRPDSLSLPQELARRFEHMVASSGLRAMRERVRQAMEKGEVSPLPDLADGEMGEEAVRLVEESRRRREQ